MLQLRYMLCDESSLHINSGKNCCKDLIQKKLVIFILPICSCRTSNEERISRSFSPSPCLTYLELNKQLKVLLCA